MGINVQGLLNKIIPAKAVKTSGAATPTFNASSPETVLSKPTYMEYKKDLVNDRLNSNSKKLLEDLFISDPDVSAAMSSYLTMADTDYYIRATDAKGNLDSKGIALAHNLLTILTTRLDYSTGYDHKPTFGELVEDFRYMVLLRGGIGAEIMFGEGFIPVGVKNIDLTNVEWFEKTSGILKPQQVISGVITSLDLPSFFTAYHRKSPLSMYSHSCFVSSINTIAARQQLINDLYRVMTLTGFPRMDIEVVEEVLMKGAPEEVRNNPEKLKQYVSATMQLVSNSFSSVSPDQAFMHTDAVKTKILNEKNPAAGLDITHMISVLNAQNQAGLRAMSTVLGRGEAGVNTASTEARLFSLNADKINKPIAALFSKMLTMLCRMYGNKSTIELTFLPCELRPDLELEPQRLIKQTRLQNELSLGIISDDDYHLQTFYQMRPASAPILSGTGFKEKSTDSSVDTPSPNTDPLSRSVSPDGSKTADSNQVKK